MHASVIEYTLLNKDPRDTSPRLLLASNKKRQNGGVLLRDNQII